MEIFYAFREVYSFQNVMDPILESKLKNCKTQHERDEVIVSYQTSSLLGLMIAIMLGILFCGVFSLFTN